VVQQKVEVVQVYGGKGSPRKSSNERKMASAFLNWKPFSAWEP
jgi:hypothetical protein